MALPWPSRGKRIFEMVPFLKITSFSLVLGVAGFLSMILTKFMGFLRHNTHTHAYTCQGQAEHHLLNMHENREHTYAHIHTAKPAAQSVNPSGNARR